MTSRDTRTRPPSPWWPRREPWRPQPVATSGAREAQLAPAPPPPPRLLNRVAGGVLLAATLGLASCQALIAAVS
jgi:hypothetical protein